MTPRSGKNSRMSTLVHTPGWWGGGHNPRRERRRESLSLPSARGVNLCPHCPHPKRYYRVVRGRTCPHTRLKKSRGWTVDSVDSLGRHPRNGELSLCRTDSGTDLCPPPGVDRATPTLDTSAMIQKIAYTLAGGFDV